MCIPTDTHTETNPVLPGMGQQSKTATQNLGLSAALARPNKRFEQALNHKTCFVRLWPERKAVSVQSMVYLSN